MTEYPYANVISNLRKFIEGIPSKGVPDIIDVEYLKQIGFTNSNDFAIISVLSFVNLIDDQGKPTKIYTDYRISSKQEETMSQALKTAYADLFKIYPDAHEKSKQELTDFFKSKTKSGTLVVSRMVSTFLILCEFSTMNPPVTATPARVTKTTKPRTKKKVSTKKEQEPPKKEVSVVTKTQPQVVVNIQLVLPETKDSSLYEELFKALKKHLLE